MNIFGRRFARDLAKVGLFAIIVFTLCEVAIYPIVLYQCAWPSSLEQDGEDGSVLKAMFIADTHLLGPFRGHWFDKLRREWQMHRAFQTAIAIFKPEVVFFLGDLFDEGEWVHSEAFQVYLSRFEQLFNVPDSVAVYVVAGNHDIGFHHSTGSYLNSRFHQAYNTSSVRLVRLKEANFVLVNSVAMEMDGCSLCKEALVQLDGVEKILSCQKSSKRSEDCKMLLRESKSKDVSFSVPILLQHFPLYRPSDAKCTGEDSAPDEEKQIKFRQSVDCLTPDSSKILLHSLKPRLIMSGHTHHYCLRNHTVPGVGVVSEYSVPSFSWRNRNDPSLFLGHFTKDEYALAKCVLPKENTVINIYAIGGGFIIIFLMKRPLYFLIRMAMRCKRFVFR